MPRNGTGTYALPKPPFQPQTAISSADVNADLADIANALTGSIARDGQAGMTGVLPLAASGFIYSNDDDTGIFRSNSNEQTIKCGGQNVLVVKTDGVYTGAGAEISSFVLGVPYPWIFASPAPGTVFAAGQPCTSSYPRLRALLVNDGAPFGNNGVDPLFPNLCGVTIAGRTTMGGSDRGNLTGGNVVGATLGAQTITLTEAQIPAHSHTGSGTTSTNGDHAHTGSGTTSSNGDHSHTGTGSTSSDGSHAHTGSGTTTSVGDHTHTGSGTTSGQSASHTHTGSGTTGFMNANNPHNHTSSAYVGSNFANVNGGGSYVVPTGNGTLTTDVTNIDHGHAYSFTTSVGSSDHSHTYSFTTSAAGGHSHDYSFTTSTTGAHTHTVSIATNTTGAHTHTYSFTTSTTGAHAHTYSFTTSTTGGGSAHNNVQPTIVLNYIMRAA